jgi:hypothetical protein
MSKKESKIERIKEEIEAAIIIMEGTVIRNHKGDVLFYTYKAMVECNRAYDLLEPLIDNELLESDYRKEIISRIKIIEENLPYLQSGN